VKTEKAIETLVDRIITLTMNSTLDKSSGVAHVAPDRKLRCASPRHEPGGGGINVSKAIHRLGGKSTACFTAGGAMGQMLESLIQKEGIDYHLLRIEGHTRVNLTLLEEATEQQYRFVMPGPELTEGEWQYCLDEVLAGVSEPAYIVASGSLPRSVPTDFYARLAHRARDAGHRLVLDTSGDALRAALSAGVHILKPNMRELAHLVGHDIEDEAQQESVTRQIIENGQADVVLVSLGAAGALLVCDSGSERIPAPTVKIRSKIGAGDSMVAGFVLALAQGNTFRQAAHFAVAAGSAAVMTTGSELCRREDTERLYDELISRPRG
jgi:6-phosphofructokinase 2